MVYLEIRMEIQKRKYRKTDAEKKQHVLEVLEEHGKDRYGVPYSVIFQYTKYTPREIYDFLTELAEEKKIVRVCDDYGKWTRYVHRKEVIRVFEELCQKIKFSNDRAKHSIVDQLDWWLQKNGEEI